MHVRHSILDINHFFIICTHLIGFGRKTLLLTMSFAMAADLVGLGIAYIYGAGTLQIILVLLFVVLFEFSLGPIVWIYMSEIMTDKGQSLGTLVNWILTIAMALLVPLVLSAIGGYLFIAFGVFCGIVSGSITSNFLITNLIFIDCHFHTILRKRDKGARRVCCG